MLLGQSLFNVKAAKHEVEITDKSYQLSPKKQAELFDLFFYINPKHYKLDKQSVVNTAKNQRLDILYAKYSERNNVLFPENINYIA